MAFNGNGLVKRLKLHAETVVVVAAAFTLMGLLLTRFINFPEVARAAGLATVKSVDSLRMRDSVQTMQIVKIDTTLREIRRGQELTVLVLLLNQPGMTDGDKRRIQTEYQRGGMDMDTLLWRILAK